MSAEAALELARHHGVHVDVEDGELVLSSEPEPPGEVLDALRANKPEIIIMIAIPEDFWTPGEWRALYEKWMAKALDRGAPRAKAAAIAFEACVIEFTERYPAPSEPGRCAYCTAFETPGCSPILPFGPVCPGGDQEYVWLHRACWPPWRHVHRMRAIEAMQKFGIKQSNLHHDWERN